MNEILYLVAGLVVGIIVTWIIRKLAFENSSVPRSHAEHLQNELSANRQELATWRERTSQLQLETRRLLDETVLLRQQLGEKERSLSATQEQNKNLQERLANQQQTLEQIGKKFEAEFRVLAQDILDEKTKVFHQAQENQLGQLLNPLRDNIRSFKEEFEKRYKHESDERVSLREQIRHMLDLNQTLSAQAENLTKALTNNVKSQGDWGEGILESILQYAGLQKDLQYFVQQTSQNEAGEIIRPDIIIKYPDGRALVVDSKVSLLHYTRIVASDNKEERVMQRNLLLQSFRQHVDTLSRKDYQSVADALDFIIMFIPIEAAYIEAMQADVTLWQFAYQRRVLLISPTNLVPAMKLVSDMWQRDSINRNAIAIAERAGKLYDKLVGFVENFEKAGLQLDKAGEAWREAQKQLTSGRGNLISQAEKMRELHIKATKKLPGELLDQAEEDEE